ncbi:MAG: Late competence protein ComEC, DNA transport [uncultured Pyrinomonadaceae bacterium]|uniref:Late competence protein ComEC, DNA transport n=1 Tax=uncultured Pyrinomonadaceae bacterium TaxID=2283094 RepID=A0A6J4Q0K6_9BACT|nr:MAG: Late competence protein ComEC, DNA transport [uncultured Pyrinomonadaceae bacterium]
MPQSASANFTLYPFLWLSICFAGGILSANFLTHDWKIYLIICFAFAIAAFFIKQNSALFFISAAFVAVGGLHFQIENQPPAENRVKRLYDENRIMSGDPIEIEGVLQSEPELAVGGFFLVLKTERAIYKEAELEISGSVRLFAAAPNEQIADEYKQLNLSYGSRIRAACRLRRADDYLNAGVLSRTELLDQKQIDAIGIIKSPLLVEKIGEMKTASPLGWIYERRQNLIVDFRDNFNVSTAGVLIASLLGNSHFLDKQTAEVFRAGGTFHVLVISGLHITFIGGLTLLLIRFFTNQRLGQFVIACVFLWAYALAVGADVPVVRAAIMFTILLFSQVIYRHGTLLNSLGFCALILLVWRPNDIFTASFQLTFVSLAAIVAIAFPLVEKLRAIGSWSPSAETPFPPRVSVWLKRFCETLYWREAVWEREVSRQLWTANLFKAPYLKWLEAKNLQTFAQYFFEALLVSAIVQICLLPLTVVYFHRFPVLSIFLNLWVGIVIACESFTAIAAVCLANINETIALPLIRLTELLNWLLVSVPNFFTENNWANLRLPAYSGAMQMIYVLYFAPLIFLAFVLNKWNPFSISYKFQVSSQKFATFSASLFLRVVASLLMVLFALIVFHPFGSPPIDGRLHIDFLDVGQGDAALITFPNGETLLVDGGGRTNFNQINWGTKEEPEYFEPDTRSVGEAVVSEFLWARGYSQIDYILATHADSDHIQGLSEAAMNFSARAAIFGRTPAKDAEYAALDSILEERGIGSVTLSRGDVLTFGAAKIEVLYPPRDDSPEAVSDNNHSLVLRVVYGDRKFLLTGDIERETERELTNAPAFLQADLVKVAHHGSRTSSVQEFISASKAKIAVVSVGRESPYGHPHEEVVERWKNSGAKVLTTGENGTISISTDGQDLQLKVYRGKTTYR